MNAYTPHGIPFRVPESDDAGEACQLCGSDQAEYQCIECARLICVDEWRRCKTCQRSVCVECAVPVEIADGVVEDYCPAHKPAEGSGSMSGGMHATLRPYMERIAELEQAMRVVHECLSCENNEAGSFHAARAWLDARGIYNDDLNDLRVPQEICRRVLGLP